MDDFPEFMRNRANLIKASDQHTPGIKGYIFDGANGHQIAAATDGPGPALAPLPSNRLRRHRA